MLKNGVEVQTELAEGRVIQGSRVQLQQVMLNLIVNAVEAMSQTSDDRRELLISTQAQADCVLVAVRELRPRPGGGRSRASLRGILHDEVERPGDGTIDLPFDHRAPRRAIVGRRKRAERRGVSIHGPLFPANFAAGESLRAHPRSLIDDEVFAASRLSMMRIIATRTNAVTVVA